MLVLLALLLPAVPGYLFVRLLWPAGPAGRAVVLLRACLGTGLGLGAASLVYFAWLVAAGTPGPAYPWVEGGGVVALTVALASVLSRRRQNTEPAPTPAAAPPRMLYLLTAAVGLVTVGFLADYPPYYRMVPHGINDSIMFWNLRARFLARGGDHWRDGFGPMYIAPDYPLLLPATVARSWAYDGEESTAAPALVALVFALATAGTLVGSLAVLRGRAQAALGLLLLFGETYYFETAAMQVADVPIGFFYLGAAVLLCLSDRSGRSTGLSLLAGVVTGFAAWTKNDGQLFVAAVLGFRVVQQVFFYRRESWRGFWAFVLGLVPAVVAVLVFKLAVAPPSDFVTGQGEVTTLARLRDPGRYEAILKTFATQILLIGPGLVVLAVGYGFLVGPAPAARRAGALQYLILAGVMLVGYAAVYLITPHDLQWRLDTSFDRLRMQLWPLTAFAFFLWVATPEESLARPESVTGAATTPGPSGHGR